MLFFLIFTNFSTMNFFLLLIFSTLLTISSNNWMGCWMGLEINLLSFIPLICSNKNLMNSEAALKYFLIQCIASMNLLFFIFLGMMNLTKLNSYMEILMNSTLLMKMGAAPFHFWFVNIVEGLSWLNCFILMTWQKITPMILLSYYYNINFLISISILSMIIGSIGGLNQTSLRKLLTFSSINHISWMIMALTINMNLWNFYFLIYLTLMMLMILMFNELNIFYLSQNFSYKLNNMIKIIFMMNLMSLGGLPPFLGFLPKWIMMNELINNNMYLMTFMLTMSSLITLSYYLKISYHTYMISPIKTKWMKFNYKSKYLTYINSLTAISFTCLMISTLIMI